MKRWTTQRVGKKAFPLRLCILGLAAVALAILNLSPIPGHAAVSTLSLPTCWNWEDRTYHDIQDGGGGRAVGDQVLQVCTLEGDVFDYTDATVWAQDWTENPVRYIDYMYVAGALLWNGSELGYQDDDCTSCAETETVMYDNPVAKIIPGTWKGEGDHYFESGNWNWYSMTWIQCPVNDTSKPNCTQAH